MRKIKLFQKNEATECVIYQKLAEQSKNEKNKKILEQISQDEKGHRDFWKSISQTDISPSQVKVYFYYFLSKMFGLSFGLKLMEKGESFAQGSYEELLTVHPAVRLILENENEHEQKVIEMISDLGKEYAGSMILGLNDALVELTGALAGLTLAIQDTKLIAMIGFITGTAASFSMAGSEYLSTKEEGGRNPLRASVITGTAYIITVLLLITPYFMFLNPYHALLMTLLLVVIIIALFTFYSSVSKNVSFKNKFFEMLSISLGVAAISFFIGFVVRKMFNVEI